MAENNNTPFYSKSGRTGGAKGGNKELRLPVEIGQLASRRDAFKTIAFVGKNDFLKESFNYLKARIPHNFDQGHAFKEIIAAKLLNHALDGRALTVDHTKYILQETIDDIERNITNFAAEMHVDSVDSWTSTLMNGGSFGGTKSEYVNTIDSKNKTEKDGAMYAVEGNIIKWTITPMNNWSNTKTIYPAYDVRDVLYSDLAHKMNALEAKNGKTHGITSGLSNSQGSIPCNYVAIPVNVEPTLSDIKSAKSPSALAAENYQEIAAQERIASAAERAVQIEAERIEKEFQENVFDKVYQHIANTVVYDAMIKSHENEIKYGSSGRDAQGNLHPYDVKKSQNHGTDSLLSDFGIRIPEAGNYYYRQGFDQSLSEVKEFIAAQFPTVDPDKFATDHLSNGSYFKMLSTINTHLSENAPTHLLIPFQDMAGNILGAQTIADDEYSRTKGTGKSIMKSIHVAENDLFMNLGSPISDKTRVLVAGEGAATAVSLAIALFGPNYAKNPEIAVIASVHSHNLKLAIPKINENFQKEFGAHLSLQNIVAIDMDTEKSSINPNSRVSFERTRDSEKHKTKNPYGATYTHLPAHAGLEVFKAIREKGVDAHVITVPRMYNQLELDIKSGVTKTEYAASLKVTDFNDMINIYGVEKTREILQPQIKAMQLGLTSEQGIDFDIKPNPNAFASSARDFAFGDALQNFPDYQAEFIKAMTEFSPAQKEFQNQTHSLANALHGMFKDKEFRGFVNDYVSEIEKSNPNFYEQLNVLRHSLGVVDLSPTMNAPASEPIKTSFMSTLLSIQLNDPNTAKKLDVFADNVANAANNMKEDSSINPVSNLYMAKMVEASLKLKDMDKAGVEMMSTVYDDYLTKIRPALTKITSYYLSHSDEPKDLELSERLKLDEKDYYLRKVDPEIIAQQLGKESKEQVANPKPDDNSPSMGM